MQKLLVTMKDIQRHKILKDVIDKRLKGVEAAELLDLTPVDLVITGKSASGGRNGLTFKSSYVMLNPKFKDKEEKK
jgi:hypothetical protein